MNADEFAWLQQLLLRLDRAIRKWEAAEEEVDVIRCYVMAFLRQHEPAPRRKRRPVGQDPSEAIADAVAREKAQKAYAAAGAAELKMFELRNGDYEFLIDGHQLKLPPRLAALLIALARPDSTSGASLDALVPWKSREYVRQALAPKGQPPIRTHALNGLVSRLRKALQFQIKFHRDFVVVHPVHGLRFAVQKKAFVGRNGDDLL